METRKYEGRATVALKSRVTAKSKELGEKEETEERELQLPSILELPEHPATVGCSVTVGMSTEYAREKLEVFTHVSLPCRVTEQDVLSAYAEARYLVMQEAQKSLDAARKKFFPHINMDE